MREDKAVLMLQSYSQSGSDDKVLDDADAKVIVEIYHNNPM